MQFIIIQADFSQYSIISRELSSIQNNYMQLIVESPGMLISDRLHHLIQEKFEHLEKMYSRVFRCLVVLKKERSDNNLDHKVEATVTVPGKLLFATESDSTFEGGIQKVVDSLLHQLRKYKDEQLEY